MASARLPLQQALSLTRSSRYVCKSCKSQLQRLRPFPHFREYASKGDLPLTEKIRRKIWGTDNPPGLADPYGGPSFLEKRRTQREAARRRAAGIEEQEPDDVQTHEAHQSFTQQPNNPRSSQLEQGPYVEAQNWEGLEHIGHLGDWRDFPPEPEDDYVSWHNLNTKAASSRQELLSCLHQAMVECLACKEHDIDPQTALLLDSHAVDPQLFIGVQILPSDQSLRLQFPSQSEREQLVTILAAASFTTENLVDREDLGESEAVDQDSADRIPSSAQEQESRSNDDLVMANEGRHSRSAANIEHAYYEVADESFLGTKLNLHDPLAFNVLKRFSQLSGHRIPDHILNATVSGDKPLLYLFDRLNETIQPKPKNLAEKLMTKSDLAGQGNVWVLPRRETPVDKEKEVGRWKIIEKELQDRGLPVLGKLQA